MKTAASRLLAAVWTALIAFALSGCSPSKPGMFREEFSSYDGVTRHTMNPAALGSPEGGIMSTMLLGLYYAGDPDWIFINAEVFGVALIEKMGVNIDGDIVELLPEGGAISTDVDIDASEYRIASSKARFEVAPELIRRINGAEKVLVRLHTSEGFVDGDFSAQCGKSIAGLSTTVCDGFAKFMSEVVDKKGESE